jgi:hypothetical protein
LRRPRKDDRRHFGRRTKPQIDPRHIAVRGALLQKFNQPPAITHRRFPGIVSRAAGHGRGVEQKDQIDIGGVIEFAAAQFSQRKHCKPRGLGAWKALKHRRPQRCVDRRIGEIAEVRGHLFE